MNPLLIWLRRHLHNPNLGVGDCLVRIVAGLLLTALAIDESIGSWGYVGLMSLVTGTTWVCPAYRVLGLSTAARSQ